MKTLIFDFDGTIADSLELSLDIAYELTGMPHLSPTDISRMRKLSLLKVIMKMRIPLYKLPTLLLQGRQKMHQRIGEVKAFEGMPEVIKDLHDSGHHMLVMSSNSEQNVRAFLKAKELETYFDGVYGGAAIFNKAAALKRIMRKNRRQPKECYYIGDEMRDVIAATKAGAEPVAVAWGYQHRDALSKYHPWALVDHPHQLITLFNEKKS